MKSRMESSAILTLVLAYLFCISDTLCGNATDNVRHGHMQPFGTGPSYPVEEMIGFPALVDFFENFVRKAVPLKMSGAMLDSAPVRKWSDEYFLSLDVPADNQVLVETRKKEDRKQDTLLLHFHEFVRTYNDTENYMVQTVPPFLQGDYTLPYPLQCEELYVEFLADAIMWFSSGGTKSVVHTDSLENINCLIRGEKEFVMVDPQIYGKQVDIDHKEGAYSSMDVDSVDFDKFPGMEGVQFYHVNMTAGDCLYIPYKWIHQVRSYGRNIAVNLWWDHYPSLEIDLSKCTADPDPNLTLDKIEIKAREGIRIEEAQDFIFDLVEDGPITFEQLLETFVGDLPIDEMDAGGGYMNPLLKIVAILDLDEDGQISLEEVEELVDEDWEEILDHMENFNAILDELEFMSEQADDFGRHRGDYFFDDEENYGGDGDYEDYLDGEDFHDEL